MAPALRDGERVLVDPEAYRDVVPVPGDIVLAVHPFRPGVLLIKRVAHVTTDGRFFLLGDNRFPLESTDSRSFGPLRLERILGRYVGKTS